MSHLLSKPQVSSVSKVISLRDIHLGDPSLSDHFLATIAGRYFGGMTAEAAVARAKNSTI